MIDKLDAVMRLPVLMGALSLMLILALLTAVLGNRAQGITQSRALSASLLRDRLGSLATTAERASAGDATAYRELADDYQQILSARDDLPGIGLQSGDDSDWQILDGAVGDLLGGQEQVSTFADSTKQGEEGARDFATALDRMSATLLGSRWQSQYDGLQKAVDIGRSVRGALKALETDQISLQEARLRLDGGMRDLTEVMNGLLNDRDIGGRTADEIRQAYLAFEPVLQAATAGVAASVRAQQARSDLEPAADRLRGQIDTAVSQAGPAGGLLASPALNITILLLALLILAGLVTLYFSSANVQRVAEEHARQNERNQEAILRLLDELGSLADGDLTVQATVTEHITGAIADSINFAIEALRNLVTTIKDSAIMVDAAATQSAATIGHLAAASETQAQQVGAASDSIARMANSVEEVSGNAERAADVARHSVDVALKGGVAVRRTIEGMNSIRETIQDTSKRIKRLGESSQEIGNIVELINDIAEQTNILALNASIQASMAGEAGRGFAVVADEVQRLAERSANATKQIEVLVRTIQSDTSEAVVSMERSTTDVVGGALLAENAGAALEEIEQVSNQIASLVQNISSSAKQQALVATDIMRNTGVLREISEQTADSTNATSESIRKLAELAKNLRRSVAGFTLPDDKAASIVTKKSEKAKGSPVKNANMIDVLKVDDDQDEVAQV